uniref:Uncharacterized protein n=1 Tax=Cajanus cajan TaxID=3821 RepID=A0A151QZX0_CAJCA|nr:hypothetical protein KK1_043066 [Cajanus cajan]KYP35864.1 hypothetical protein KK1_043070 [Cajanus cajan]KYP35867.1 hypothetical protein KK1_043073 [Cajanus cajan]
MFLFFLSASSISHQKSSKRRHHGFETEAASLTAPSLPTTADCTVSTDMLGDDGPSPLDAAAGFAWAALVGIWLPAEAAVIKGFLE